VEEIAACEEGPRRADEEIALILRPKSGPADEADGRGRHGMLPTEQRLGIPRPCQQEERCQRVIRRIGDERRRPARLLQPERGRAGLDALEIRDAPGRTYDLNPAPVEAGADQVDFIEAVIAIFFGPQGAGEGVEGRSEERRVGKECRYGWTP